MVGNPVPALWRARVWYARQSPAMKLPVIFLFLALPALMPTIVRAGEPAEVYVVTGYTPGWANTDGTGFIVDLMKVYSEQRRIPVRFEIHPMLRTLAEMKIGKSNCTIGGDEQLLKDRLQSPHIYSLSFFHGGLTVYSLKGKPPVDTLDRARQLRLGVEQGMDMQVVLKQLPGIGSDSAPANAQVQKMKLGRIDGYVGLFPPSKENASAVSFNRKLRIADINSTLHCERRAETITFINDFNRFVRTMSVNGQLRSIYDRYYPAESWIAP